MASLEALSIQCDHSCDAIENKIKALTGLNIEPLPRIGRDPHILRRDQLQKIADWLELVAQAQPKKRTRKSKV